MNKLTQTPSGRMIIHCLAVGSCLIHFHCPHGRFFLSAMMRYLRGQG